MSSMTRGSAAAVHTQSSPGSRAPCKQPPRFEPESSGGMPLNARHDRREVAAAPLAVTAVREKALALARRAPADVVDAVGFQSERAELGTHDVVEPYVGLHVVAAHDARHRRCARDLVGDV